MDPYKKTFRPLLAVATWMVAWCTSMALFFGIGISLAISSAKDGGSTGADDPAESLILVIGLVLCIVGFVFSTFFVAPRTYKFVLTGLKAMPDPIWWALAAASVLALVITLAVVT